MHWLLASDDYMAWMFSVLLVLGFFLAILCWLVVLRHEVLVTSVAMNRCDSDFAKDSGSGGENTNDAAAMHKEVTDVTCSREKARFLQRACL